jgi:hypothetical protein
MDFQVSEYPTLYNRSLDRGVTSGVKSNPTNTCEKSWQLRQFPALSRVSIIASFFGLSMDKLGTKVFLLHLGIFALFVPLVGVERWSKGVDPFR